MKYKVYIMIFFFLPSCNHSDCKVDSEFKQIFETSLNDFSKSVKKKNGDLATSDLKLLFFFEKLTKIKTNAHLGDVCLYNEMSDLRRDVKAWKKWYNDNSCEISGQYAKDLMNDVMISTKWKDN